MLDRIRTTPWHAWVAIAVGLVGLYLAWVIWRNHASANSAVNDPNAQPSWASLGANESALDQQLAALQQYLTHPATPAQPTSSTPVKTVTQKVVQTVVQQVPVYQTVGAAAPRTTQRVSTGSATLLDLIQRSVQAAAAGAIAAQQAAVSKVATTRTSGGSAGPRAM